MEWCHIEGIWGCCWDITWVSVTHVASDADLLWQKSNLESKGASFPLSFLLWTPDWQIKIHQGQHMCSANTLWKIVVPVDSDSKCYWNLTLTILNPGTTAKRSSLGLLCPQGSEFPQNSLWDVRGVATRGQAGSEGRAGNLKHTELAQWCDPPLQWLWGGLHDGAQTSVFGKSGCKMFLAVAQWL